MSDIETNILEQPATVTNILEQPADPHLDDRM
jgi:hypothetical protein